MNWPKLGKDVNNYLHSVTTAFRNRPHDVLENHMLVLVDVDTVLKKTMAEKEKKEEEDKWGKVVVSYPLSIKLTGQTLFKEIPGAADRIESARVCNFNIKFVKMVYEVIAFFRSPQFIWYLHTRLILSRT